MRRYAARWRRQQSAPTSAFVTLSFASGEAYSTSRSRTTGSGNSIGVSGGLCSWDLHAVWDRCIIEEGLPGAPYTLAQQLLGGVTDNDRATWQGSSPIDWANESFAISTSPEVQYCVGTETGCWHDADDERLDQGEPERIVVVDRSYIETNGPTVADRLVKAGIRLGGLLEQALGESASRSPAQGVPAGGVADAGYVEREMKEG